MLAFNNRHAYHEVIAELHINETISFVALDKRQEVVSGHKGQDFVGYMRAGVGVAYDITTVSQKSFASDIAQSVYLSLSQKGHPPYLIDSVPGNEAEQFIELFKQQQTKKGVILVVNEWKSDTYMGTKLIYDLSLLIYDANGTLIANERIQAQDSLKGSFWKPIKKAKKEAPGGLKKALEYIFGLPNIVKCLEN